MLAVTIKRRHRGAKAGKSIWDKGMYKKQLLKDLFRLAFKIDKIAPTDTEMIVEKNRDNNFYHGHQLIRNNAIQETANELLKHIEASSYREEYRWNERLKRDVKYYRSIDGKSGEVYYTEVYSEKEWLDYIGKTEASSGEKHIFISKKKY
ncbi:hypothetical protein N9866_00885 [Flavobacteriaceae bacterium]|nr:hypothetical protein [Flavobacteriaceae bacterium]MDB4159859.1 hypothetical protein [Flavobacteriaceae bacterium]MDB4266585.1 hypothetical protein [Flavobacteriaceae bacterium]